MATTPLDVIESAQTKRQRRKIVPRLYVRAGETVAVTSVDGGVMVTTARGTVRMTADEFTARALDPLDIEITAPDVLADMWDVASSTEVSRRLRVDALQASLGDISDPTIRAWLVKWVGEISRGIEPEWPDVRKGTGRNRVCPTGTCG